VGCSVGGVVLLVIGSVVYWKYFHAKKAEKVKVKNAAGEYSSK